MEQVRRVHKLLLPAAMLLLVSGVMAQAVVSPASAVPALTKAAAFEVVSIKPGEESGPRVLVSWGATAMGYSTTNVALARVIVEAYLPAGPLGRDTGVPLNRLSGAPSWVMTEPYSITAKVDEATMNAMKGMTKNQQAALEAPMLRTMLEDRFRLVAHTVAIDVSGYALVVSKHGLKMKESQSGEALPPRAMQFGGSWGVMPLRTAEGKPSGTSYLQITMAELAATIGAGPIPVLDQTGLTAKYDVQLPLVDTDSAGGAAEGPQLDIAHKYDWGAVGLEMKPIKSPVMHVVVEHIERPSEN